MSDCVFCDIVQGKAPAEFMAGWPEAIVIVPLNPVTEGHVIVIPRRHVRDALVDPATTAATMGCAVQYAKRYDAPKYESCNIITSVGVPATQTIRHLHLHVVPRQMGDGLHLPWTGQHG